MLCLPSLLRLPRLGSPPFLLAGTGKKKELWAPLISPTFLTAFRELGVLLDRFRVASLLSGQNGFLQICSSIHVYGVYTMADITYLDPLRIQFVTFVLQCFRVK